MDCAEEGRREEGGMVKREEEGGKPGSVLQRMNHIQVSDWRKQERRTLLTVTSLQSLLMMAVENAKQEEKSIAAHTKSE